MEASTASPEIDSPLPAEALARRALDQEFQASMEALREAQERASKRDRRETRRTRLLVLGVLATAGIFIWNTSLRRASPRGTTAGRAALAAPLATVPVAVGGPAFTPSPATASAVAPASPAPAVSAARSARLAAAECDSAFADGRWPAVVSACEAAFATGADDGAMALRIAQALHRRGYIAASGEWARKAIALDDELPEAFAILARAETAAGHPHGAAAAYRRYLKLAPRGWHAAEARRALRD